MLLGVTRSKLSESFLLSLSSNYLYCSLIYSAVHVHYYYCNCFSLGLRTTKGVLLYGPPGTGKTSLALSCVRDAGVNLFFVNGPEIISQFYGESEQALHEVFESASQAAPAVVRSSAFSLHLMDLLSSDFVPSSFLKPHGSLDSEMYICIGGPVSVAFSEFLCLGQQLPHLRTLGS